jgi:hypothetical protein
MITFTHAGTFVIEHCCNCGMAFAMTTDFQRRRIDDKRSFYCPAGHSQHYTGESAADRAQRLAGQLDMERTRRQQAEHQLDYARRSLKATSTRLKKVKARVGHGVCPCCNRTFQQLARHMASEHPTYGQEPTDG